MTDTIINKGTFRVREFLVDTDKVVFVHTAMGTNIGLYRLFVKLMNQKGYSCVVYDYSLNILFDPKLHEWQKFYEDMVADGQERIEAFKRQGVKHFYAYGVSMGTLIANKLTRDTPDISHLILNLTYGDVAQTIWTYRGTKKTKEELLKQGVDETALRESVHYADPVVNAEKLKGKKVLLYLSRTDKILVYDQAQYTKKAFESAELDFEYVENRYLGHYLGGLKNMLAITKIDQFYSS